MYIVMLSNRMHLQQPLQNDKIRGTASSVPLCKSKEIPLRGCFALVNIYGNKKKSKSSPRAEKKRDLFVTRTPLTFHFLKKQNKKQQQQQSLDNYLGVFYKRRPGGWRVFS